MMESGLYSITTTGQILDGNDMKQGLNAHIAMYQALFDLYLTVIWKQMPE